MVEGNIEVSRKKLGLLNVELVHLRTFTNVEVSAAKTLGQTVRFTSHENLSWKEV